MFHGLVIDDVLHDGVPLHRLLLSNPDELLLQRNWSKAVVEIEKAGFRVNSQKNCDIL